MAILCTLERWLNCMVSSYDDQRVRTPDWWLTHLFCHVCVQEVEKLAGTWEGSWNYMCLSNETLNAVGPFYVVFITNHQVRIGYLSPV